MKRISVEQERKERKEPRGKEKLCYKAFTTGQKLNFKCLSKGK